MIVLSLSLLTAACGPVPPLSSTFSSEHALADRVLEALAARDIAALQALPLSEREFREAVWPELPSSQPDANLPVDYAWGTLRQNSEAHLGRLLEAHGGREYRLVRVRFEGPATPYRTFVVRRPPLITVRDEQGVEREVRLFGSVIERPRAYKLFSYVTD